MNSPWPPIHLTGRRLRWTARRVRLTRRRLRLTGRRLRLTGGRLRWSARRLHLIARRLHLIARRWLTRASPNAWPESTESAGRNPTWRDCPSSPLSATRKLSSLNSFWPRSRRPWTYVTRLSCHWTSFARSRSTPRPNLRYCPCSRCSNVPNSSAPPRRMSPRQMTPKQMSRCWNRMTCVSWPCRDPWSRSHSRQPCRPPIEIEDQDLPGCQPSTVGRKSLLSGYPAPAGSTREHQPRSR